MQLPNLASYLEFIIPTKERPCLTSIFDLQISTLLQDYGCLPLIMNAQKLNRSERKIIINSRDYLIILSLRSSLTKIIIIRFCLICLVTGLNYEIPIRSTSVQISVMFLKLSLLYHSHQMNQR